MLWSSSRKLNWNINHSSISTTNSTYSTGNANVLDTVFNSQTDFCSLLETNCNDTNIESYNYQITLTIEDSYGCINSFSDSTSVYCQPTANFDNSDICIDNPNSGIKIFNNLSIPQLGMNWLWEMGDNGVSNYLNNTLQLH